MKQLNFILGSFNDDTPRGMLYWDIYAPNMPLTENIEYLLKIKSAQHICFKLENAIKDCDV